MGTPRFFLAPDAWGTATAALSEEEGHHCRHVLRLGEGDRIVVFDGRGREASATLAGEAGSDPVSVALGAPVTTPRPPAEVTLAQAIPKGKGMDTIIQKATELGAARIVPVLSERTVVRLDRDDAEKRAAKWRKVAVEAAKQCGQNWVPEIAVPTSIDALLGAPDEGALRLVASLQPDSRRLKEILSEHAELHGGSPRKALVLVGPEGDFTPAEMALAKAQGCQPLGLGPIVLRSETAAVHTLSILGHELF